MPLYHEWSPREHALAAIWHISEPEAFFSSKTGLSPTIKHPRKRIEHLCGRFLLRHLKEDFPLLHIAPDEHDKPRLPEDRYYFSISHSYPYVAAIISDREDCGIDIQTWKNGIEDIAHMYLSHDEIAMCGDAQLLTLAWAAKEAAYKWWGRRGADFIRDLPIKHIGMGDGAAYPTGRPADTLVEMHCFGNELRLEGRMDKDFAMAWMAINREGQQKLLLD